MSTATYSYEHVTSGVLCEVLSFRDGAPKPGERLPQMGLPTADGGHFRTGEVLGHRPVLLIPSPTPAR